MTRHLCIAVLGVFNASGAGAADWDLREEWLNGQRVHVETTAWSTNELAIGLTGVDRAALSVDCNLPEKTMTWTFGWPEKLGPPGRIAVKWGFGEDLEYVDEWVIGSYVDSLAITIPDSLKAQSALENATRRDRLTVAPVGEGRRQSASFDLHGAKSALTAVMEACWKDRIHSVGD